jgi:hypothetical protein
LVARRVFFAQDSANDPAQNFETHHLKLFKLHCQLLHGTLFALLRSTQ